jgi:hypothetical protein
MTDRDVVEKAAELLEASIFVVRPRQAHWRTAYGARVTGRRAAAWMNRLRPLMGERRRSQIDRAVASYAPDPNRRLDDAKAREALRLLAVGESVTSVAERFGTSIWCIYDLRLGRTHRHLSRAV